ncbi:DEKNAAC102305 [Brettanomyces naardenensis]|uniref:DEKNAAC102305 n=1 Tax=Brettanomyces naardenensis TaxID=13370 RepID=A0A448YKF4_BRENA|nr:DEKNAAC102305 [Brettanomyces naardenensis]
MQIGAILKDETTVTHRILEDSQESTALLTHTITVPGIDFSCEDEVVYIKPDEIPENDNITIVDVKLPETGDAVEIEKCTCLSNSWQVSRCDTEDWQFVDEQSDKEADEMKLVVLHGSHSELLLDDDGAQGNDIVPKNDLKYASRLVKLFMERNSQLNQMINLNTEKMT